MSAIILNESAVLFILYKTFQTKSARIFCVLFYASCTVEPCLKTTPLIRPPRYYSHFIQVWKKLSQSFSYLNNPFNTTSFSWPEGGCINGVPLYKYGKKWTIKSFKSSVCHSRCTRKNSLCCCIIFLHRLYTEMQIIMNTSAIV